MKVIRAHNVNDAYYQGVRLVASEGVQSESRNGPVLRFDEPVSTVYGLPHERVLFDRRRHANPFFHLFEALWMLNGGNDVATMDGFLKSFKQFSDDGITFHGAYGHRWRHWPVHTTTYTREIDQIAEAITMLNTDETSRRVVIGMWDPARDLNRQSNDIPCNDMIKLWISDRRLHMVVFNRSNDVVWGCYGANAVHMSMLHEYIAAMTDTIQGTLTQISCDFHAYLEKPYNLYSFLPSDLDFPRVQNPYETGEVSTMRLVTMPSQFDAELKNLMHVIRETGSVRSFNLSNWYNMFFGDVVLPMHLAWELIREQQYMQAIRVLNLAQVKHHPKYKNDWIHAGMEWIEETLQRKVAKNS